MTVPQQRPLVDFIKERRSDDEAFKHRTQSDIGNIKSQNALSREEAVNRTHYPSAPATSSKRQLAGQNARIQQQPTKLERSRSLFEAPSPVNPSPVDLSEVVSHTYAYVPRTFKGSAAHKIKEEYSQRQNNARDGFDTDVDDDFDDITTMSHDIQVGDSQTHFDQSVEMYDDHGSAQEPMDIHNERGITTLVDSHGMDHADSLAARTDERSELSEGADYAEEEEEDSESDGSGEDGRAEDDPTLNSTSMGALLRPSMAQALGRELNAIQNTKYSNQQFPENSLGNHPFPPTSNHEENFDLNGHLPSREVTYRGKSNSPGFSNIPSAIRSRTGAIPLQQGRHAYEAKFHTAPGMDMFRSNTLIQTSERLTDESLYAPVFTANTTSVKRQSLRPLQHQALTQLAQQPAITSQQDLHGILHDHTSSGEEQQQSIQLQNTPYRSPVSRNGSTPVPSVPSANLNDDSSFSLSDQIMADEKVLPPREDQIGGHSPHQPDVTSARGQKRIVDLDYTEDQLSQMSYNQLRSECFDFDPKCSVQIFPEEVRSGALTKQFEFVKDLKDLTDEQRSKTLRSFFSSLTIDKYEECGDMILELFSDILTKFKDARQEKRKITRKYEEEISHREETVDGASLGVDNEMKRIRQAGSDLLKGSGV